MSKEYQDSLLSKGNRVLVKVVRVNGFHSTIHLSKDISSNLETKLAQGFIQELGDGNAAVKFELIDSRTIKMTSTGDFYVFGNYMKAVKVSNQKRAPFNDEGPGEENPRPHPPGPNCYRDCP